MNFQTRSLIPGGFLCGCLALAGFVSAAPQPLPDAEEAAYPAIERFVEVLDAVRKRHPDTGKLAYERLVNHALEGMLSSLDPHSSFIHPEMVTLLNQNADLEPEVPSLGLTLGMREDGAYVSAVALRGPAAEGGALPGSALLEIDGQELKGVPFADLVAMLHRAPGVTTRLLLKTPAEPRPVEVSLIHRFIEQRSVADYRLLENEKTIGYLRLASFGDRSAREVEAALDALEDQGMKALVFDLRQNGGGDLLQAVNILGYFLPPGTTVVTTRGREKDKETTLKTPDRQRRKRDYPVIVLIDRMSASASELMAGALQDLKRAMVIGELSYGKGSVQNILPMGGGTALRLTIATYHTPSGRTPHLIGITPDIPVAIGGTDARNFLKSCQPDTLSPDEKKQIEVWKDPVMEAAVARLKSSG
ncbi:MAG: S41 family peptidase [Luteolibacter sp.]